MNRIDYVLFVDYQDDVERPLYEHLPENKKKFIDDLKGVLRHLYKSGLINPFSTRDLKSLITIVETLNDDELKDVKAVLSAIEPVVYKLLRHDLLGYPDYSTLEDEILKALKEIIKEV